MGGPERPRPRGSIRYRTRTSRTFDCSKAGCGERVGVLIHPNVRSRFLVLLGVFAACKPAPPAPTVQASPSAVVAPPSSSPAPALGTPTGVLLDVATFGQGECVLRKDGRVVCWKEEPASRTPIATELPNLADVARIGGSDRAINVVRRSGVAGTHALAFGTQHTTLPLTGVAQVANRCVLLQTGAVSCDCLSGWTAMPFVSTAIDLASVGNHSCVASQSGDVTCWGQDLGGVLGVDAKAEPTMAAQAHVCPSEHATTRFGDVVQVAVSESSSCARHRSGTIDCWGAEGKKPVRIPVNPSIALRSDLSATCSLDREGHADCWGDFFYPTLDGGRRSPHPKPTRIPLDNVTAIDMEGMCAIQGGARVVCWNVRSGCQGADCLRTYEVTLPE